MSEGGLMKRRQWKKNKIVSPGCTEASSSAPHLSLQQGAAHESSEQDLQDVKLGEQGRRKHSRSPSPAFQEWSLEEAHRATLRAEQTLVDGDECAGSDSPASTVIFQDLQRILSEVEVEESEDSLECDGTEADDGAHADDEKLEDIMNFLAENGECRVTDLVKRFKMSDEGIMKWPDFFELRYRLNKRNKPESIVRLAGIDGIGQKQEIQTKPGPDYNLCADEFTPGPDGTCPACGKKHADDGDARPRKQRRALFKAQLDSILRMPDDVEKKRQMKAFVTRGVYACRMARVAVPGFMASVIADKQSFKEVPRPPGVFQPGPPAKTNKGQGQPLKPLPPGIRIPERCVVKVGMQ
eukprot:TRINITY_DN105826_c0_g1_i1.p1 TRINITY_DN105826_c0_g1~~TRINITY_DN105826_c0_g1_i1.p1  ORF type:complete len:353 (-),score=61.41 TRINITY_DN105826_c0_g1_i1:86-1144(-)